MHAPGLLVVPTLLAGLTTFPLLTAIFDVVGIFGGYLVGVQLMGLSSGCVVSLRVIYGCSMSYLSLS